MKIVRFKDGAYGIRRFTPFGYQYKDLVSVGYWWALKDRAFIKCKGTLREVTNVFDKMKRKTKIDGGTPVFKKKINFSQ